MRYVGAQTDVVTTPWDEEDDGAALAGERCKHPETAVPAANGSAAIAARTDPYHQIAFHQVGGAMVNKISIVEASRFGRASTRLSAVAGLCREIVLHDAREGLCASVALHTALEEHAASDHSVAPTCAATARSARL